MRSSFTIIGRGLAGAVLYEALRERGAEVRVIDVRREGSASQVATGVVNPVVLRRTVLSWRAAEMLPIAEHFYRSMEERYGVRLWHPLPLVKVFSDERERGEWERRSSDPVFTPFLSLEPIHDFNCDAFRAPWGYGVVKQCAWLDVPAFLDAQRAQLLARDRLFETEATGIGLRLREAFGEARHLTSDNQLTIHCTGPFSTAPGLVPVKGETLTVRIPGLNANAMVHRSAFLLPLGDALYRLGSTFAWDDVWTGPSEKTRRELLHRLSRMMSSPVEVVDHSAGVRPTARDRRPILGHPSLQGHPQGTLRPEAIFNGLGSRGVLLAPWCAMHLADHLLHGAAIDPEVDAARFA